MSELLNFNNTTFVFEQNLIWLAIAFGIGAWVGYVTCIPSKTLK